MMFIQDTLDIVAYPMDNISKDTELLRPNIKFDKNISVTTKLDGVQILLYWYKTQWHTTAFNFIDRYSQEKYVINALGATVSILN
jgi:hypothetical protein